MHGAVHAVLIISKKNRYKIIFFPRYERYFFAREAENWQEMATSPARRTPGAGKREEVCCVLFLIEEAVSAAVWRSSKKNRGKMLNYSQYFNNECMLCTICYMQDVSMCIV